MPDPEIQPWLDLAGETVNSNLDPGVWTNIAPPEGDEVRLPDEVVPPAGMEIGSMTITQEPPEDPLRIVMDVDFDGPIRFNFGDGNTDEQGDSHTAHRYDAGGDYEVAAASATHTASGSVTVAEGPAVRSKSRAKKKV